jgi:hypothetical protein
MSGSRGRESSPFSLCNGSPLHDLIGDAYDARRAVIVLNSDAYGKKDDADGVTCMAGKHERKTTSKPLS